MPNLIENFPKLIEMEESAKRRERLKAMRVEADQAQAVASPNLATTPMASNLSNPFAESTQLVQETSSIPARFDFYTDPMAAFSGHKRKMTSSYQNSSAKFASAINHASPLPLTLHPTSRPGPGNLDTTPSPCKQFQKSFSPCQQMYEAPQPYHASRTWGSSAGMANPFPGHEVAPPGVSNGGYSGYQQTPPGPRNRSFPGHQGTPPGVWNVSGGRAGHGYPSNSPRGSGFPSTGPSSPSTNSGRGNGGQYNNHHNPGGRTWSGNPNTKSGRGRGGQHNSPNPGFHGGGSPSSNSGRGNFGRGGGRGRGQGSDCGISAQERPDRFYDKSIVEDPWSRLTPVVRTVEENWLPKSISMKRDQPKDQPSEATRFSSSGLSLAECLAASFEEVAGDVHNI